MGEKGTILDLKLKESDQRTASTCSFLKKSNYPQLATSQLGARRATEWGHTQKTCQGPDSFNKHLMSPHLQQAGLWEQKNKNEHRPYPPRAFSLQFVCRRVQQPGSLTAATTKP